MEEEGAQRRMEEAEVGLGGGRSIASVEMEEAPGGPMEEEAKLMRVGSRRRGWSLMAKANETRQTASATARLGLQAGDPLAVEGR